jgi:hypothetical protein
VAGAWRYGWCGRRQVSRSACGYTPACGSVEPTHRAKSRAISGAPGVEVKLEMGGSGRGLHDYPVKYLDFFDSALKPQDCVVDGHLAPLLKRISYEHEHEVRAFIEKVAPNPRAGTDVAFWRPEPIRLPIDVKVLVKAIYISPYAGEPFPICVAKICEAFGVESGIVRPSQLLSGHEELLDRLSL